MVAATFPPQTTSTASKLQHLATILTSRLRANKIRIPPYPAVAARLQQIVSDPRHTTTQVADIVANDATLAASILSRAGSAAQGARPATSIATAVGRLGMSEVMRLVLATSLGVTATSGGPLAGLRRDAWRRSVIGARFARELAPKFAVNPDEAFVAGLVHDFGEVIVVAVLEGLASEYELPTLAWESWQTLVQSMHVDFGTVVAARWNLPPTLADVVAHHHEAVARPLVQLVSLVDRIVAVLDASPSDGVAALVTLPELAPADRDRIANLVPELAAHVAGLEASAKPSPMVTSKIALAPRSSDGWDVAFEVVRGVDLYQAVHLAPNDLVFEGSVALQPNWLTEIEIRHAGSVKILMNVTSCERLGKDRFKITARPFGLGGDSKRVWFALLAQTRPSLQAV